MRFLRHGCRCGEVENSVERDRDEMFPTPILETNDRLAEIDAVGTPTRTMKSDKEPTT
jgi:hypothetical protein